MLWVSLGPYGKQHLTASWSQLPGRISKCLFHFLKVFKDTVQFRGRYAIEQEPIKGGIWLLVQSRNNLESLRFVKKQWNEPVYIALNKHVIQFFDKEAENWSRLSFHSCWTVWYQFFSLFIKLWPVFGSTLLLKIDEFFNALGRYEASIKILRHYRPSLMIFANDHHPDMRAVIAAANDLNIPTVYIQHASVSELFPPLRFKLSLLEGQDSWDKYKACGTIEGEVRLIGMPKFDHFVPFKNRNPTVKNIGLCANWLDDQQVWEDLIVNLTMTFPDIRFTFRAHPRDSRVFNLPGNVSISSSKQTPIFEFLRKQDMLIAGDTSTHLEAVLLNIVPIYFQFNTIQKDYYGYLKNGLVEECADQEALKSKIRAYQQQKPDVFEKAQYYNAVAGTPAEGKSGELAIHYLKGLLA